MSFPLADWILSHPGLPHDLAQSGMKGEIPRVGALLRSLRPGDPGELRARLGHVLGIPSGRVVLTIGATTANSLVLLYLYRRLRARSGRRPRAGLRAPEYPPLWDTAEAAGFQVSGGLAHQDLAILSNPNNPEGTLRSPDALERETEGTSQVLVDETFREFTPARSLAARSRRGLWATGTFTKIYGADDLRLGYVVPPPEEAEAFRNEAELWVDRPPLASVGGALAILEDRERIVGEARGIFGKNLAYLRERVPDVPSLKAPVWFDRALGGARTLDLARAGVREGVLVCPGHYFRDPSGTRLCLTRRSFPRDLDAYLALRRAHALPKAGSSSSRTRGTPIRR